MKKLILCICVVAIATLTAININYALNRDSNVNITLASAVSIAQSESGNGFCKQFCDAYDYGDVLDMIWTCGLGDINICFVGYSGWDMIYDNMIYSNTQTLYCSN